MSGIKTHDTMIETPNGRLFAREWRPAESSDAAPIVFFHDSLGSVELWRDFPSKLVALTGRPAVAYDRLGFGRSDPHPAKLKLDFIRDEARSALPFVRQALGIDRMILFGHSVGGGMAVACGARLPHETEAVITLSAQAFLEDRTVEGIKEAKVIRQSEDELRRLQRYHGDKGQWVLDAWIETWLAPSFANWSLDDDLRQLHCPVLAMHGDEDEFGSRAHPDRIAALAHGPVQLVIIENCRHMPQRDKPDVVLRLMSDFILRL